MKKIKSGLSLKVLRKPASDICFKTIVRLLPVIVLIVLFADTGAAITREWFTNDVSYGLVFLLVSLYMTWVKRQELGIMPALPAFVPGFLLTAFGCLLLLMGKWSGTILLQEISLVLTVIGFIWLVQGTGRVKILSWPLAYTIFMLPLPGEILGRFSIQLQKFSAFIASLVLSLVGIPVFRENQFILLPHITLEVAKECSGINHIIALTALAVPIAFITQKTAWRKSILVVLAFFLGVFTNGLRIAMIGVWSRYHSNTSLHGPFSMLLTSFIFFSGFAVLVAVSSLVAQKRYSFQGIGRTDNKTKVKSSSSTSSLVATMVALAIFSLTGALLLFHQPLAVYPSREISELPMIMGKWSGKDVEKFGARFENLPSDIVLKRVYHDSYGREFGLYMSYFASQTQGREVVNYTFDQLHEGASSIKIRLASGEDFSLIKSHSKVDGSPAIIHFWYNVGGRNIINRYLAKLATAMDALLYRRTNGAIIVIISKGDYLYQTRPNDEPVMDFMKNLIPLIINYLN